MTSSFSGKWRAVVLDRLAEIPRSEIRDLDILLLISGGNRR